jgi:hypothetical protein
MAVNLDIGIIRRDEAPARHIPYTIASTAAFVTEIEHRYVAGPVTISRAELAVACQPKAENNYFYHASRIEIAPKLSLQEHNWFAAAPKKLARAERATDGYGEAEASALFQRLFSRQARVAPFALPPGRETEAPISQAAPIFGPTLDQIPQVAAVERALARPVVQQGSLVPAEEAPPFQPSASAPEWEFQSAPFQPAVREIGRVPRSLFTNEPQPITLPAPEIRRVAEQVMREIDHRIVARRERLGRR